MSVNFENMRRGATIIGDFRYHLWRSWGPIGCPSICFVMLNPSTADANDDDPTLRFCIGIADALGYWRLDVVNLYAYRATQPSALRERGFPVGPSNDDGIRAVLQANMQRDGFYTHKVIVAWGTNAQRSRADAMLKLIRECGHEPLALKVSKLGAPEHPLYKKHDIVPMPYRGDVHPKCYAWARSKNA
jgi:hypothetical protein